MKKMIGLISVILGFAAISSAQDIRFNFDADANFASFRTYKWVQMPGGVQLDELITRQLTAALDDGLKAKGLSKVHGDTADLYIGYEAAISQERQVDLYGTGGFGMGPRWGGGMVTATTSTLTIGSISLDMYEVASKHLVWRGTATKTVDANAKPDKRQKNISTGVSKLLKNYPPKKK